MKLKQGERSLHWVLLIWGLLWWFCSGLIEIEHYVASRYEANAALCFISISMLAVSLIARALSWKEGEYPPVFLLPAMFVITLFQLFNAPSGNLLADYGFISWVLALSSQMLILYRCEWVWRKSILSISHAFTMYLYIFLCSWIIADLVNHFFPIGKVWEDIVWGLIPAFAVLKMIYLRDRLSWPVMDYPQSYVGKGLFPVVFYLGIWTLIACYNRGNPAPIPYVSIINPLELVQLLCISMMLKWVLLIKENEITGVTFPGVSLALTVIGGITFIWISSVVAHSVHFYAGVRFDTSTMLASEIFQASISIVWTLMAFVVMFLAAKKQYRKVWFVGATLLGTVVIKLFLIDLADSGGIARIVSFMTVGILVLVIGYFSPIPPRDVRIEEY